MHEVIRMYYYIEEKYHDQLMEEYYLCLLQTLERRD